MPRQHSTETDHARSRHLAHPRPGLSRVVPAGRPGRRPRRAVARARLHGDQALGLRHLGADAARSSTGCSRRRATRTPTSRSSSRSRYLEKEAKHVEGFAKECAVVTHHRLELGPDGKLIPTGQARGAARRAAHERDDHRRDVRQVDPVVARPADAHQPVGQRRPLGDAAAAVSADGRVSLAGGAHRPCHARGGRGGDAAACSTSTPRSPSATWRCR